MAITPSQNWTVVRIGVDPHLSRYLVEKGSITVDGVSLTVSAIGAGSEASGPGEIGAGSEASGPGDWFEISLIPTTLQETTLGSASVARWSISRSTSSPNTSNDSRRPAPSRSEPRTQPARQR